MAKFGREIRGEWLIEEDIRFLNHGSYGAAPKVVLDAQSGWRERMERQPVRFMTDELPAHLRAAAADLAGYLGADGDDLVFVDNATTAVNAVLRSLNFEPGDEIVISTAEHHSNIVPWQLLREQTGAVLKIVPITDSGALQLDDYEELLGPRTRLVAITHVSNALGTINPVGRIVELAHRRGIPVLIDGAQAAPHMSIDVTKIDCDFYAITSHKMFGPVGVGALYGRYDLLDAMPPYQGGGEMILSVSFEKTTFNHVPHRYEAGTPNIAGAIGMGAAVDYLDAVGLDHIGAYEQELLRYATEALSAVPGVRLVGTAKDKAAVVSFLVGDVHPHDVGTILDQEGIAVRTGHHCAQPVMERYGIPATARASMAFYNTKSDIDALVVGIHKVLELFG